MVKCKVCGHMLRPDARYCTNCGTLIAIGQKDISPDSDVPPEEPADPAGTESIPVFTPPKEDDVPIFTPPSHPGSFDGPACYHHPYEPAVASCARCGKPICQDCAEAYTVTAGEYADKSLCFDCCQELVEENITSLKAQKTKIIVLIVATGIGMLFGLGMGSIDGSAFGAIFCMLWFGSFWNWLKNVVGSWWHTTDRSGSAFIGSCLGGLLIAPIQTIVKIVQCIRYLIETSHFIEEDSNALAQMRDYMEYTQVMSQNRGVDLETLMGQGSELYNNSYAKMVRTQGEAAADAELRRCTTTIAENGEIIRNFSA